MAALIANRFSAVEYMHLKAKDLATKGDLQKEMANLRHATKADLQKEIASLRYDTLKFVIWTGVSVIVVLGGMLARGFHWW